jgi:hypothetical protein
MVHTHMEAGSDTSGFILRAFIVESRIKMALQASASYRIVRKDVNTDKLYGNPTANEVLENSKN